ncbi:MAG TPA: NAD+ synthase [Microthrixaceae bacterium]|nr:NAD+ synthase [Microthrixaceae bacterium]
MTDPPTVRVALCQLDLVVGDLEGNAAQVIDSYRRAEDAGADLAVFPELAITGYPPEDLLLKPGFVEHSQAVLADLAARIDGRCVAVVGWVEGRRHPGADPHDATDGPWNAAAVLHGGRMVSSYRKQGLPNYSVFDEKRYFDPGTGGQPLHRIAGVPVAVTICEDMWMSDSVVPTADRDGAALVVNLNASPFHVGKQREREELLRTHVERGGCPIVYVNLVGGQDELVFDGGSVVLDGDGRVLARCERFEPAFQVVDVPVALPADPSAPLPVVHLTGEVGSRSALGAPEVAGELGRNEEVWSALVLGLRDYVTKNGFDEVVIGLSGGVDSSIVAAIAVDALGPGRVHGVLMPSRYSSEHSVADAVRLAENLGIEHRTIPIEPAHAAMLEMLTPVLGEPEAGDLTEENLQSRLRGVVLMALSNRFGWLVLTTGNKSETAVGYSTLYGDTAGGLAVIKDVPKLLVYELCRWRNERAGTDLIPEQVLTKAPSAELRPDQRDQDSLPPYEELDPIIEAYVDGDMTVRELVAVGHDEDLVRRIARLVDLAEYKRRQAPPGIRISEKAFGRDRRLPITNRYRGI